MARLTNQIIFVCAFLTNFLPALVPMPSPSGEDVEDYFAHLPDSETGSMIHLIQSQILKFFLGIHIHTCT